MFEVLSIEDTHLKIQQSKLFSFSSFNSSESWNMKFSHVNALCVQCTAEHIKGQI